MATTTLYCSRADVELRLSDAGVAYLADDDGDGEASETDMAAVDRAILEAGAEIDAALTPWINALPLTQDDGARNVWLRARAVEIASAILCGRRGHPLPESIATDAERSRHWLDEARAGALRVPGLTYPVDSYDQDARRIGKPKLATVRPL